MKGGLPRRWNGLLAAILTLALVSGGVRPAVARPPALTVDARPAVAMLDLLEAAARGEPWSRTCIADLLTTPAYAAVVAHHRRVDEGVTGASMLQVLATIQEEERLSVRIGQLARMQASYRMASERIPELRARLEALTDPAVAARAVQRVQATLPRGAWLGVRVCLILDGYSATYVEGDAIYLDLLQIATPEQAELCLGHELHHIGLASLLPAPCGDPALGIAVDTIAGLVQEGAATYWIDGWEGQPTAADLHDVQAFLLDVLEKQPSADEIGTRLSGLLGYEHGPLYRVGNRMIAGLVAARGEDWVRSRLADPVALLRAYEQSDAWPEVAKVLEALDRRRAECPSWLSG